MARGGKKEDSSATVDPVVEERTRLKKMAFSKDILSQNLAKSGEAASLGPSKLLIKHHGKDILRKSQRKNRYLFSFPGLFGPISGGKIGDLKDLGTKNPILYLDFPQGRMKLFGTIVYPKNRYLTLQFSKGGKSVTCEDYFDTMIVFSDAWWIGTKDENPEEVQLQFPKELNSEKLPACDFKGGVGVARESKSGPGKSAKKYVALESSKVEQEDDTANMSPDFKELGELTPSRHSARTAGKKFNFAEASSGDDVGNETAESEEEEEKIDFKEGRNNGSKISATTDSSFPTIYDIEDDDVKHVLTPKLNKQASKSKDLPRTARSSFLQTTLSSMFKKLEDEGKKSEGPALCVLASESSNQNDSSQDMDCSDEDWTF